MDNADRSTKLTPGKEKQMGRKCPQDKIKAVNKDEERKRQNEIAGVTCLYAELWRCETNPAPPKGHLMSPSLALLDSAGRPTKISRSQAERNPMGWLLLYNRGRLWVAAAIKGSGYPQQLYRANRRTSQWGGIMAF